MKYWKLFTTPNEQEEEEEKEEDVMDEDLIQRGTMIKRNKTFLL
jgi:hypothetical protein